MARRYAAVGPSASGSGPNTAVAVVAAATVRPAIYEVMAGSSTTPADQTFQLVAQRFTAAGTGTSVTPEPLDASEAAALSTAAVTHSAEPTYTSGKSLLDVSINQRATFRWVAAPGGELRAPATASNGIGVKNQASSAALVIRVTVHWEE